MMFTYSVKMEGKEMWTGGELISSFCSVVHTLL